MADVQIEKCGVLALLKTNAKAFSFLIEETIHQYDSEHDGFLVLLEDLSELKQVLAHEGLMVTDYVSKD